MATWHLGMKRERYLDKGGRLGFSHIGRPLTPGGSTHWHKKQGVRALKGLLERKGQLCKHHRKISHKGVGAAPPQPHTLTSQVPRVGQLPWFPQRTLLPAQNATHGFSPHAGL